MSQPSPCRQSLAASLPPELLTQLFQSLLLILSFPSSPDEPTPTQHTLTRLRSHSLLSLLQVCKTWRLAALPLLYEHIPLPLHDPLQGGRVLRALEEGRKGEMVKTLELDDVPDWVRRQRMGGDGWDLPRGVGFDRDSDSPFSLDDSLGGRDGEEENEDLLSDEPPDSPLRTVLHALQLCPKLLTLSLTLRSYPSSRSFRALCLSLQKLNRLETLELRCTGLSRFRPQVERGCLFTPSHVRQLVLPLKTLRNLTIKPVSHHGTGDDVHSSSPFPTSSRIEQEYAEIQHPLEHLTLQGQIYTIDLLSLLSPFPKLKSLQLHLTRESCITHQALARVLWRLRGTIEDLSLLCVTDNLRFADAPGFSAPAALGWENEREPLGLPGWGKARGSDLPLESVLPHLTHLRSLALNIFTPRSRWHAWNDSSAPAERGDSVREREFLFSERVFDLLPDGLRVFKADIWGIPPGRVTGFLRRALGASGEHLPPTAERNDEEPTRRSPTPEDERGPSKGIKLSLAVDTGVWRPSGAQEPGTEEAELRELVLRAGGRYTFMEGWTSGPATVDIEL